MNLLVDWLAEGSTGAYAGASIVVLIAANLVHERNARERVVWAGVVALLAVAQYEDAHALMARRNLLVTLMALGVYCVGTAQWILEEWRSGSATADLWASAAMVSLRLSGGFYLAVLCGNAALYEASLSDRPLFSSQSLYVYVPLVKALVLAAGVVAFACGAALGFRHAPRER